MRLQVKNINDFEILAAEKGWADQIPQMKCESLAAVRVCSLDSDDHFLEPTIVYVKQKILTKIDELVIISCNDFGLIYKNAIYPFGFCHSQVWLSETANVVSDHEIDIAIDDIKDFTAQESALLGMTNHWGHFFIDALDRIESLKDQHKMILVSGSDFMGLDSRLDDNGLLPQVSELIGGLGYPILKERMLSTVTDGYYLFDRLESYNLQSEKPAISSKTFLNARDHFLARFDTPRAFTHSYQPPFLYIGRSGQKKRRVENETEIEQHVTNNGGEVVKVGTECLSSTIPIFSNADRIILIIGSAKFNLLFCKPNTKVICVVPQGYARSGASILTMVRHICSTLDLKLLIYEVPVTQEKPILINSGLRLSKFDIDKMVKLFEDM